jgi:hypothetical protein
MRLIVNLVLVAVIAVLIWVLYSSISEPIEFQKERRIRKKAVVEKLEQIRKAQEIFRDVSGAGFAPSFDSLKEVLRNGQVQTIKVEGDPDDPSGETILYDTIYEPAMKFVQEFEIDLDSLEYVPFNNEGVVFEIEADTITYQSTLVNVVEVKTIYKYFMGKYADPRFARYDKKYNPNSTIKFGDMYAPNLSGNWE